MASVTPPVLKDAIYGVVNNAYTFDVLGRDKYGRPAVLSKTSPRDSFYSMIEQWSFSMPLKSQWFLFIEQIPKKVAHEYLAQLEESGHINKEIYQSDKYTQDTKLINKFAVAMGTGPTGNLPTVIGGRSKKSENILDKMSKRLGEVKDVFSGNTSLGDFLGKTVNYKRQGGDGSLFGCRFVDSVSGLPGESVEYQYINPMISGGYRGGYASGGRAEYAPLIINFKETNTSMVDFVIRPWIKMVAHEGLICNPDKNDDLTTVVNIVEYARSVNNKPSPARKQWVLFNCAPIAVAEDALNYDNDSTWPVKATTWRYTHAVVLNYDGFDKDMMYKAPSGPSMLSRFIPGSVSRAVDVFTGESGTVDSVLSNNSPI